MSRRWTGKTLAEHRADRRAVVLAALGLDPTEHGRGDKTADRYHWQPATPAETPPRHRRLLHAIGQRWQWRAEYEAAKHAAETPGRPPDPPVEVSATTDHAA